MTQFLSRSSYSSGQVIFEEGSPGNCAYLVETGEVEIYRREGKQNRTLAMLGKGELFGEMALIDDQLRSATARARTNTELIPITREHVKIQLEEAGLLTRMLLKVILRRFRESQLAPAIANPAALPENGAEPASDCEQFGVTEQHAVDELVLLQDLKEALRKDELEVHYQPILNIASSRIRGFEALVRWNRRGKGYVPPDMFIQHAENAGLIIDLGRKVFETACKDMNRLRQALLDELLPSSDLFMSINVSAHQLFDPLEFNRLKALVSQSEVSPEYIKLELTERVLMDNPELAQLSLRKFKEAGFTIAVDDFGTGYSSLSYLARFPIDTLKIDRSFISVMLDSDSSHKIVRSIISLGRELGMDTVAEGIERSEELAQLKDLGCNFAQGYLVARPMPIDQAIEILLKHEKDSYMEWEKRVDGRTPA